jgi:nucleoside-diphosphate-sugar epimerase
MSSLLQEDLDALLENEAINWSDIEKSSVLITGATGLVGAFLVRTFLNANEKLASDIKIYCPVRNLEKARNMFGEQKNLTFIQSDIRDELKINADLDYIIHCAAVTVSKQMVEQPVETLLTAVEGTKNILELARVKSVKSMVYISSMEVYGSVFDDDRITEDKLGFVDVLNVRSNYPEGKRVCENMCKAYQSEYGVNVKIARLAQTFGTGISKDENRVFAQFARSVMKNQDIVLHTEGKSYGNYCYTMDTVSGILCILQRGENGAAYNVVNESTTMSIREMAELVLDKLGNGAKVVLDIPESSLTYGYAPDTRLKLSGKKLEGLGWKPTYDLVGMYQRMIESMDEG